jgi:hypothetical protein
MSHQQKVSRQFYPGWVRGAVSISLFTLGLLLLVTLSNSRGQSLANGDEAQDVKCQIRDFRGVKKCV